MVAFLAIYLGSRVGEVSVGENQPNTTATTSETLEDTSSSNPTENAGDADVKTEEPQVIATSSARNQTPEPVTPRPNSVVQTPVRERDSETKVTREPQPGMSDRNRPVGAERPRRVVKPAFEQPSVSSIEAIMSGVPYERRNRWADEENQMTEDQIRRREMRRTMRENRRRRQAPF
jgi:hypothetical protein